MQAHVYTKLIIATILIESISMSRIFMADPDSILGTGHCCVLLFLDGYLLSHTYLLTSTSATQSHSADTSSHGCPVRE